MKSALGTLALAALLCGCNAADDNTPPQGTTVVPDEDPADVDVDVDDAADVEVPERFRGDWAVDAAACDTRGHVSRLHIGDDDIRFHESAGPIVSVAGHGNEVTVLARLTGEGETRDASYTFVLSGDGSTLADANGFSRQRCD